MRLIACDKYVMFSDALVTMLGRRGHEVAARICSPAEAVALDEHDSADAWIVDIDLPLTPRGRRAVAELRALMPQMPICVFTSITDREALRTAVDDGADGVVLKSEGVDEVERVLRRICTAAITSTGQSPECPTVWSRDARAVMARSSGGRLRDVSGLASLTAKEHEVVRRLTNGDSTELIAAGMGIGVATVRTHLQHLYTKLNVHSRLELVSAAARLTAPPGPRALSA
ncbi:MAG: response regulator transcription factor [Actinomycetota bacterium]|nr:response regulator transcription factor [Actinomycetota bacterium]